MKLLISLEQARGQTALCREKKKKRTIIHSMSELWKCFVFVDHTWLQVGFNEGKHLHFRSEFSKAPSSTSVLLLPQKPPVKPPSNDSSASFWEALPVHTANNTAWIMLLCTVCIGCICLARCLCSPHPSFIGSWDGTKEQTTETLLACSSLLIAVRQLHSSSSAA